MGRNDKDQNIKPKGLNELLNEDPTLRRKMNYEEIKYSQGIDDTPLEAAYKVYCKTVSHNKHNQNN